MAGLTSQGILAWSKSEFMHNDLSSLFFDELANVMIFWRNNERLTAECSNARQLELTFRFAANSK